MFFIIKTHLTKDIVHTCNMAKCINDNYIDKTQGEHIYAWKISIIGAVSENHNSTCFLQSEDNHLCMFDTKIEHSTILNNCRKLRLHLHD